MSYITPQVLHDLGITKTEPEEAAIIEVFDTTLQARVGETVRELLDDAQADELLKLSDQADPEALQAWLQANVPDYAELAKAEYDILLGELAENAKTL